MPQAFFSAAILFMMFSNNVFAGASIAGENSGDGIKLLFTEARIFAIDAAEHYDYDTVHSENDVATSFAHEHDLDIAHELKSIPMIWGDFKQSSCATTNGNKGDPIYLDYAKCSATTTSMEIAATLLLHEATHHFGLTNSPADEALADEVAIIYLNSKKITATPVSGLYAAIAYDSETGKSAATWYYRSQASAEDKARRLCSKNAKTFWAKGGCQVLYAVPGRLSLFSHALGSDLNTTKNNAKNLCENQYGTACFEVVHSCSW
jgi:Domain of unknown function (DUF4189)